MGQLGQVLPRLIVKMAEATLLDNGPLVFVKLNIKDGYWQMVVAEGKEFLPHCCPLSPANGLGSIPTLLCAVSETARDVAEVLLANALLAQPFSTLLRSTCYHQQSG